LSEDLIHAAGITDLAEARMLVESGFRRLGFPFALAYHAEDLDIDEAAAIVRALGSEADPFLITYLDRPVEIQALCRRLGVSAVQLHGDVSPGALKTLRGGWPDLHIIKSLIVRGDNLASLERESLRLAPWVDAFITDTFDPRTGATGATGRTHDWAVSRTLVRICPRPVILAGGLSPENVRRAILEVRPAGVDVHTGIEGPDGRKDRALSRRFVREVQAGFAALARA
jgi:phosphoribosylanthranilate isomerase